MSTDSIAIKRGSYSFTELRVEKYVWLSYCCSCPCEKESTYGCIDVLFNYHAYFPQDQKFLRQGVTTVSNLGACTWNESKFHEHEDSRESGVAKFN